MGMDRDVFFIFGSMCRLLAGKVPVKDWQAYADAIWTWSRKKVEKAYEPDVPDFVPNGNPAPQAPVKVEPPPPEKPVEPKELRDIVYISDEQTQRFVAHCHKQGLSAIGIQRFLKDQGISGVAKIPLTKARDLWERAKEPEVVQQYR
jgi:hypothetical protein